MRWNRAQNQGLSGCTRSSEQSVKMQSVDVAVGPSRLRAQSLRTHSTSARKRCSSPCRHCGHWMLSRLDSDSRLYLTPSHSEALLRSGRRQHAVINAQEHAKRNAHTTQSEVRTMRTPGDAAGIPCPISARTSSSQRGRAPVTSARSASPSVRCRQPLGQCTPTHRATVTLVSS